MSVISYYQLYIYLTAFDLNNVVSKMGGIYPPKYPPIWGSGGYTDKKGGIPSTVATLLVWLWEAQWYF